MAGAENDSWDFGSEKNSGHAVEEHKWLGESAYGLPGLKDRPEGSNVCLQGGVAEKLHMGWCEPEHFERPPIPNDRETIDPPVFFQFRF